MNRIASEKANQNLSRFRPEIIKNCFYQDIQTFLRFAETKESLLTQAKNINPGFWPKGA